MLQYGLKRWPLLAAAAVIIIVVAVAFNLPSEISPAILFVPLAIALLVAAVIWLILRLQ